MGVPCPLRLTSADPRVERALHYIDANLDRPIRLADVARAAAVERKYFSVLFRRQTGWRLFDYVRARRLARAGELLRVASVERAAAGVGCHVRTLERALARETGLTPAAYRAQLGGRREAP